MSYLFNVGETRAMVCLKREYTRAPFWQGGNKYNWNVLKHSISIAYPQSCNYIRYKHAAIDAHTVCKTFF